MRVFQTVLVSLILSAGAAGPVMAQQIHIGMPNSDRKPRPDPRVARDAAARAERERRAEEARIAAELSAQAETRRIANHRAVQTRLQAELVALNRLRAKRRAELGRLRVACRAGDKAACSESIGATRQ